MKREDPEDTIGAAAAVEVVKRQCPSGIPSPSAGMTLDESSDHKTKKYDRQLRLWGDHGQAALERAKVCLIGATATGAEILKNLVLPGLGSFCIVDHETVKATDLGNNFFVTAQDLGQSRAAAVTRLLLEMNGDVQGEFVTDTIESIVENRPNFFHHFSVVVAADHALNETILKLGNILWNLGIPFLTCRAYGLIGHIRVVCKEHFVFETKAENFVFDLRLENPFLEIFELKDLFDFEKMTKKKHSHVPFLIVLLVFLEKWKRRFGFLPFSYKEKLKFREFVDEARLKNEDGFLIAEENYEEACKAVLSTIGTKKIPDEIQQLFEDSSCENLTIFSPKFWILSHALRDFTASEGAGHLPLSGALPDMFSDTESFVRLQNVYKKKADFDAKIVYEKVQKLLRHLGLSEDFFSFSEVKFFCRNSAFLRCLRTSSLNSEYEIRKKKSEKTNSKIEKTNFENQKTNLENQKTNSKIEKTNSKIEKTNLQSEEKNLENFSENKNSDFVFSGYSLEDPQFRNSMWYAMLRAVDEFFDEFGVFPGVEDKKLEMDALKISDFFFKFLKTVKVSDEFFELATKEIVEKYSKEIVRFGGEQVHSVAAFVGGAVGQEVVKLITGQYVPLNNTLIYDATTCTTSTFQF